MNHKSVLLCALSAFYLLACLIVGLASPAEAALPTIYYYDATYAQGQTWNQKYDTYHTTACIQGLANRTAPRVFVNFCPAADYFPWFDNWGGDHDWLVRLVEPGGLCEGWGIHTMTSMDEMVNTFRPYINGLILYAPDPDTGVASTSLAATTAAACENAIAVRKDITPGSMYDWLVNTKHIPVLIDLTGKFTGSGTIWGTSTPSTGSAKCDAYIWAKQKYIDTGRCDPTLLSYTLDSYALKESVIQNEGMADQWLQLSNLDYAVARKGFCFELSPWGDERPNDDPYQPLGTDLNTYKTILNACNIRTGQGRMIKFCGFPNWLWKYTTWNNHGMHGLVETEWENMRLLSAYNTYDEGDCGAVSNASFYAGLMPLIRKVSPFRYLQNPPPTYTDMRNRGLINADGTIPNGNYILIGLGDYDGAAWTLYDLANKRYNDPTRGQRYCNWGVDPNLSDRVGVAFDYMFRHKTSKDYFIAWDSGAGYLNPYQLYGSRSPSGYGSGVAVWQKHCKDFYRMFDYSISGWLLNGDVNLTDTDYTYYAPFSGDGIGAHTHASPTSYVNGVPCNVMAGGLGYFDYDNHAYRYNPATDTVINNATGSNFGWYRTVKWHPSDVVALENAYAGSGHNHRFLDAYTYYYLLRYKLSGRQQSSNYYRASWVNDTIPRIMAAGQTYPVTVTVRNDGWDTWTEGSMYRLAHAIVAAGTEPTTANFDANPRHYLPTGASVAPGQSVVFSFNITAPASNGKYDLFYSMVRDGVTWFQSKNNLECKRELIVATNLTDVDTDGDGVPDVTEDYSGTLYWHPDSGPLADCLGDTFSYPNGNLSGNGGWSGTAGSQIAVESQSVKISGGTGGCDAAKTVTCLGPADLGVSIKIKKGTGTTDIWGLWLDAPSGRNLARWYGTGSRVRGQIYPGTELTRLQNLTGGWDHLYVHIDPGADQTTFYFNGTLLTTLMHTDPATGESVGRVRFERIDSPAAAGQYVLFDDLQSGPPDTNSPVASISAPSVAVTRAGPVSYTVSFSEPVYGFNSSTGVQVNSAGTAAASSVSVGGSGAGPYTVTLSNLTGAGTLGITVKDSACVDCAGNTNLISSLSATSTVIASDGSIQTAKTLPDLGHVELGNKALYLKWPAFCYIEEPNRTAGIQLQGSFAVNEGDLVCLTGTIYTDENGERYLVPEKIAACGTHSLKPVAASNRSLRSGLLDGLFVKAWLQVIPGSVTANSFMLTDGSDIFGIKVLTQGAPGVAGGDYVTPIGAAGIEDGVRVIYSR